MMHIKKESNLKRFYARTLNIMQATAPFSGFLFARLKLIDCLLDELLTYFSQYAQNLNDKEACEIAYQQAKYYFLFIEENCAVWLINSEDEVLVEKYNDCKEKYYDCSIHRVFLFALYSSPDPSISPSMTP